MRPAPFRLAVAISVVFLPGPLRSQLVPANVPRPVLTGLARGILLELDPDEFAVRCPNNLVLRYTFNEKTWFERDNNRVEGRSLKAGEVLEVVSDRGGLPLHYARTVHVIPRAVPVRPRASAGTFRLYRTPAESIEPRGDLIFTGVVSALEPGRMTVRTRFDGSKLILLRADTRYLESGFEVDQFVLRPNDRIFVRGGKNVDNDVEAYQVIWGEIFEPTAPRD